MEREERDQTLDTNLSSLFTGLSSRQWNSARTKLS